VVPMSASSDANSHQWHPPPITAAVAGRAERSRNSSDVNDDRSVDVETRQRARHRTGRQNDVGAFSDHGRVSPSTTVTVPSASSVPCPQDGDLATLQEARKPLEEAIDDFVLCDSDSPRIDDGTLGCNAELGRVFDGATNVRGLEELLGGNAATCRQVPRPCRARRWRVEPRRGSVESGA